MEKIFDSSLIVLRNIETQFSVEILDDNAWTPEDQLKFWQNFENLVLGLKHEINKLAMSVDVNDKKKPKNEDVETLCKCVEQVCVALWSNHLRLSTRSGKAFCQKVSTLSQCIIKSTCELMQSLSKCSKRQEALQKVGEIWQKYDELKNKMPRCNKMAVHQMIQDEKDLVQDALTELEDAKKYYTKSDVEMDEDEKWSEAEMKLVAPSIGLLKTAMATLKRIQTSLLQNGNANELKTVQEMDDILSHCQKISPLVGDLAMPLYPPISLDDVEAESKNLSQELIEIINKLKTVHFVTDKEYDEWGTFILKAIDHNMTKINVALVDEKLKNLKT